MKKKTYKDVKNFVVDRKSWFRGRGIEDSYLLNEEGQMCCLGFYALACDLRKRDIRGAKSPERVVKDFGKNWNTILIDKDEPSNTVGCDKLMSINDDEFITDERREVQLTNQFAKLGIRVKFTG